MPRSVVLLLAVIGCLATACVAPAPESNPPPVDECAFELEVYPVLARDCGFPACHGSDERGLQVFAPGRTRLDPMTPQLEAATPEEIALAFDRARSFLGGARSVEESLLLRKPLAIDAGGAGHMGRDEAGRDVYQSTEAPGWMTIAAWARGRTATCP
jgi:hypothetical protein